MERRTTKESTVSWQGNQEKQTGKMSRCKECVGIRVWEFASKEPLFSVRACVRYDIPCVEKGPGHLATWALLTEARYKDACGRFRPKNLVLDGRQMKMLLYYRNFRWMLKECMWRSSPKRKTTKTPQKIPTTHETQHEDWNVCVFNPEILMTWMSWTKICVFETKLIHDFNKHLSWKTSRPEVLWMSPAPLESWSPSQLYVIKNRVLSRCFLCLLKIFCTVNSVTSFVLGSALIRKSRKCWSIMIR